MLNVLLSFLFCLTTCSALTTVLLSPKISQSNPITLSCSDQNTVINGNVIWEFINATDSNFTLPSTNPNHNLTSLEEVGQYYCKQNGKTLGHYLAAFVKQPYFENARKSVTYLNGDTNKKIICNSDGSYPPVQFTWRRVVDGILINLPSDNFTNINISSSKESSVLFFTSLTYDNEGQYECSVGNEANNGTIEVQIRVKDRLAALWPFLGILCEVSLLVFLIFMYERNSKKASRVNSVQDIGDVDKPLNNGDDESEKKPNELRNRASNNNHK